MKLVNPRLGLEVELSENQVLNITVESPVKFSEVVYHICRQAGGEEGIYIAELDLEMLREYRQTEVHGNAYRRPGKYGLLTDGERKEPFIREDYRG